MTSTAVSGLLAGYGIAMPVGAIAVLLITISAMSCFCIGVSAGFGAATIDGVYAVIAIAGGTGLARLLHSAAGTLRWVAAVAMLMLAVWSIRTAVHRYRSGVTTPPLARLRLNTPKRAYLTLAGLTVINPLTAAYWVALVAGGQAPSAMSAGHAVVFVTAVVVASASWQTLLAGGGALVGRLVVSRTGVLATGLGSSLLMALLAARIVILPARLIYRSSRQ
jgi:threonine/homoserine/homoserine lactone efflux protein